MSNKKTQIAGVLIREFSKLPVRVQEEKFLQWGDEQFKLKLGVNPKSEVLLSFGYADMDEFHYTYVSGEESYPELMNIFNLQQNAAPTNPKTGVYLKKVMAVLVYYHSEMKRGKDL